MGGVTDDDHRPAAASSPPPSRDADVPRDAVGDAGTSGSSRSRSSRSGQTGIRADPVAVVAFVAAVLVSTGAQLGGTVLLVLVGSDADGAMPFVLGPIGLGLLVLPPLVLGAVLAAWDVAPTPEARRRHGRFLWSLLGVQAVGAALVLVSAATAGFPAWLPASFIAAGAALTVTALVAGPALGERAARRADRLPQQPAWRPISRAEVRRAVRTVALSFALTFVPVAVGLGLLLRDDGDGAAALLLAAGLAFIAASAACIVLSLRMQRQVTALLGRDQERTRRINRAVASRRPVELSPEDEQLAARAAAVGTVTLPVQFAQSELLFAGLFCQQLPQALSDDAFVASTILVIALPVAMVAFAPLFLVRIRRLRRWADAHAHLLPSTDAGSTSAAGTVPERRP
jgi:hypothetical protein